jgi:hypothetical protein
MIDRDGPVPSERGVKGVVVEAQVFPRWPDRWQLVRAGGWSGRSRTGWPTRRKSVINPIATTSMASAGRRSRAANDQRNAGVMGQWFGPDGRAGLHLRGGTLPPQPVSRRRTDTNMVRVVSSLAGIWVRHTALSGCLHGARSPQRYFDRRRLDPPGDGSVARFRALMEVD